MCHRPLVQVLLLFPNNVEASVSALFVHHYFSVGVQQLVGGTHPFPIKGAAHLRGINYSVGSPNQTAFWCILLGGEALLSRGH